jgi:preprotein translocase subunit SecG
LPFIIIIIITIIITIIIIIILHPSASIIGTTGRYFPGHSYFPPWTGL